MGSSIRSHITIGGYAPLLTLISDNVSFFLAEGRTPYENAGRPTSRNTQLLSIRTDALLAADLLSLTNHYPLLERPVSTTRGVGYRTFSSPCEANSSGSTEGG